MKFTLLSIKNGPVARIIKLACRIFIETDQCLKSFETLQRQSQTKRLITDVTTFTDILN